MFILLRPVFLAAAGFSILLPVLPARSFPPFSETLRLRQTEIKLESSLLAQRRDIDPDLYEFFQIMRQFGSEYAAKLTTPELELLAQRDRFDDPRRFEIRSTTAAGFLDPPSQTEIIRFFEQRFATQGFEFQEIGRYGDGPVYRISKNTFQIYAIFAPTTRRIADGSPGTAIVLSAPDLPLDVVNPSP